MLFNALALMLICFTELLFGLVIGDKNSCSVGQVYIKRHGICAQSKLINEYCKDDEQCQANDVNSYCAKLIFLTIKCICKESYVFDSQLSKCVRFVHEISVNTSMSTQDYYDDENDYNADETLDQRISAHDKLFRDERNLIESKDSKDNKSNIIIKQNKIDVVTNKKTENIISSYKWGLYDDKCPFDYRWNINMQKCEVNPYLVNVWPLFISVLFVFIFLLCLIPLARRKLNVNNTVDFNGRLFNYDITTLDQMSNRFSSMINNSDLSLYVNLPEPQLPSYEEANRLRNTFVISKEDPPNYHDAINMPNLT